MKKKERIAELERRVAELEREVLMLKEGTKIYVPYVWEEPLTRDPYMPSTKWVSSHDGQIIYIAQ